MGSWSWQDRHGWPPWLWQTRHGWPLWAWYGAQEASRPYLHVTPQADISAWVMADATALGELYAAQTNKMAVAYGQQKDLSLGCHDWCITYTKFENTSGVSKSSSDWLNYTGFLRDVCFAFFNVSPGNKNALMPHPLTKEESHCDYNCDD